MVGGTSRRAVTAVERDGVNVRRTLERKAEGVVGSIELESDRENPVLVRVVDQFSIDAEIDAARFKPGTEPNMGEITADGLELNQRVGDESVRVEFGVLCTDPPETLEWGCPSLQEVRPIETDPPSGDRTDETTSQSDGGESASPDLDAVQTDGSGSDVLYRGGSSAAVEAHVRSEDDLEDERAVGIPSLADPAALDDRVRRGERAAEALLERLDTNGESTAETTPPDTDSERVVGSDERASDRSSTPRGRDVEADVPDGTPRSLEVRVDHLSARVEEFAAYASALEAIIADYGTGEDVLTDFEQRFQSIETQLEAVDEDVESVREAHAESIAAVRNEVARATDRLGGVESDVQSLSERLDATERDVTSVTDRQGTLETNVEAVSEDLESATDSLDSLEDDVESLNVFRRSLADLSQDDDR